MSHRFARLPWAGCFCPFGAWFERPRQNHPPAAPHIARPRQNQHPARAAHCPPATKPTPARAAHCPPATKPTPRPRRILPARDKTTPRPRRPLNARNKTTRRPRRPLPAQCTSGQHPSYGIRKTPACQAFNARPGGAKAPSPGQASEAMRHPGFRGASSDTPRRGKSSGRARVSSPPRPGYQRHPPPRAATKPLCPCFCPVGAHRTARRETQGVASLRSLALGWVLLPLRGVV